MLKRRAVSTAMLVSCAVIWGTSYIAQILGMQEIGPLTFCASRYVVSSAALALLLFVTWKRGETGDGGETLSAGEKRAELGRIIKHGAICGAALFSGSVLQLAGMQGTTAGKTAFITATFIVIVPLYGLFAGKIPSRTAVASIFMSMGGLYLLSIKDGFFIGRGDLVIFLGAFFWAAHIMACSAFSRKSDPVKLSAVQFATVALLSVAGSLIFERPDFAAVAASWKPVVYAGLVCTCVAYTFQMSAQRYVQPLTTCIIMSTESVFAAIFGYFVLGETLSARELTGCAVLFAATLIAQLDDVRSGAPD
ncbi:DMT family transporter [Cloacibacillus sp. An23]|uniref:DMT family transporter n=1 Tax=Cloacibacillus sp. An23 TaxID=1965591 RepID=UPI000B3838A7|nr:DMT family transporter [Cloacibacillus sp. An23]OUO92596.1 hypothetical protein B5F39_10590 [Cloacibacillus sp. An23]